MVTPAAPSPAVVWAWAGVPAVWGPPEPAAGTRRGRGSEPTAAPVWGLSSADYLTRCEPWPLNPDGELLLGVKLESPEGIAQCEAILAVPGLGFAELGPGDLSLTLGYLTLPRGAYPPERVEARARVFAAYRKFGVAFLEGATPDTIVAKLDETSLEAFKAAVWQLTGLIRVYLQHDGARDAEPLAVRPGATVLDVARTIHQQLAASCRGARVWGPSARFGGQVVGREHRPVDGDTLDLLG